MHKTKNAENNAVLCYAESPKHSTPEGFHGVWTCPVGGGYGPLRRGAGTDGDLSVGGGGVQTGPLYGLGLRFETPQGQMFSRFVPSIGSSASFA